MRGSVKCYAERAISSSYPAIVVFGLLGCHRHPLAPNNRRFTSST
ncbi:hypothetical protein [Okeania sp. SIO2C2]|nr:hypothetical protein [Okeania sp. SIO2C2]